MEDIPYEKWLRADHGGDIILCMTDKDYQYEVKNSSYNKECLIDVTTPVSEYRNIYLSRDMRYPAISLDDRTVFLTRDYHRLIFMMNRSMKSFLEIILRWVDVPCQYMVMIPVEGTTIQYDCVSGFEWTFYQVDDEWVFGFKDEDSMMRFRLAL